MAYAKDSGRKHGGLIVQDGWTQAYIVRDEDYCRLSVWGIGRQGGVEAGRKEIHCIDARGAHASPASPSCHTWLTKFDSAATVTQMHSTHGVSAVA